MEVIIELVGNQKDVARSDKISLTASGGMSVRDALERLRQKYPDLLLDRDSCLITVNHEIASLDRALRHNDLVCFLPHIGGG
jgi:molybdopterin converting factor small subunit